MLLLLLLLFEGVLCPGESTADPQAPGPPHPAGEEPLNFRVIQIFSFANHSWAHTQGSGWLGELQTHGWDSVLGTIRFLWPWSQGNFSKEELKNLQALFQLYFHGFTREVQAFAGQFQFECLLEAGKAELERQVKPEAWVSKGTTPSPGHLLLVCHISGFHPKPVWVMWMRGEQEQPGTRQGDVLPNADGTWYLRVTLDVATGETTGLYCRVKHSSLGGHDIIIHWDGYSILLILICLTVTVTLIMLIVLEFWFKKQSSSCYILFRLVPDLAMGADTQDPRGSAHQLCSAQESWAKNRYLKKWKTSLSQL
ncbi:T-cell surface glycoprotein CD1e, membrane-associated isoform X2 [Trichechus manatus latirostris]|uniref:T-cell surface glycoprotein CD1e, membrane-associated isoform X2 n=1 Tax=Trichechus manatus latirostris TaxID=127582 RepID=A0A2Y9QJC9_TRIMA|nr:T-cell surface glycoprotein CD1e, membrane-associated isoform X2 [Trichechus manatus latirostris]